MNIASLTQYARHKDGTYVSMDLDEESRALLDNFVQMSLGLTERVDPKTYHITIIYSRTPVPTAESYEGLSTNTEAFADAYELFPTKNDGKCLVIRVKFTFAELMNRRLTDEGATSDYGQYKPHITLAYDTEQEIDITTLPLPKFPLKFNAIKVAPLDPQLVPENA